MRSTGFSGAAWMCGLIWFGSAEVLSLVTTPVERKHLTYMSLVIDETHAPMASGKSSCQQNHHSAIITKTFGEIISISELITGPTTQ